MAVTPEMLNRVLGVTPAGFVMTAAYEERRTGLLARAVFPCASEPALVCVAARKGHWIAPLIRDSRVFAVCRIEAEDRLSARRFADDRTEEDGDPFDGLAVGRLRTGAPVLTRSAAVLDCEVARHFDLEADCELYVGHVLAVEARG